MSRKIWLAYAERSPHLFRVEVQKLQKILQKEPYKYEVVRDEWFFSQADLLLAILDHSHLDSEAPEAIKRAKTRPRKLPILAVVRSGAVFPSEVLGVNSRCDLRSYDNLTQEVPRLVLSKAINPLQQAIIA